jgi:predicted GNAT family N-acyltransferase
MIGFHVQLASTPELREAVYRLRYEVFVEEMHLCRNTADHDHRMLMEDCDAVSRILLATMDREPTGTLRLTLGKDGPLPDECEDTYDISQWSPHTVPLNQVMVCTRFALRRDHRDAYTPFELMREAVRVGVDENVELVFTDCQPHLLNLYTGLGFRSYRPTHLDAEYGVMVPLVLVGRDLSHLRDVGSPILDILQPSPTLTTERALSLLPLTPAVRSTDEISPWEIEELRRTCSGTTREGFAYGLSAQEFQRLLAGGYTIKLRRGDRLIRRENITRTLYVVLSGTLEVRDGERSVAVLRSGDVIGEIAFLLEDQRSLDVWAASDDVRVISFRDRTLRNVLRSRDRTAAQILANLARILARRLAGGTVR